MKKLLKNSAIAVWCAMRTCFCFTHNIIFPSCCVCCKAILEKQGLLCIDCKNLIRPIATTSLNLTGTKSMKVIAISNYQDPIRSLILAKHLHDIIASDNLAELIYEMTILKTLSIDIFVPVPLHWTRYARRGFNQAEEIAKFLARKKNSRMEQLLKRVKKTRFQAGLSGQERVHNVSQAFALNVNDLKNYQGKHIALVDDLMTTGSTLKAAGLKLLELKPASIVVVVAARVIEKTYIKKS